MLNMFLQDNQLDLWYLLYNTSQQDKSQVSLVQLSGSNILRYKLYTLPCWAHPGKCGLRIGFYHSHLGDSNNLEGMVLDGEHYC